MATLRKIVIAAALILSCAACGGGATHEAIPQVPRAVAQIADPLLRAVGFCEEHGAPVDDIRAIVEAHRAGDEGTAIAGVIALLEQVANEGKPIPASLFADLAQAMQAAQALEDFGRAIENSSHPKSAPTP